eukprot:NODE_404_length_1595_cov_285.521429.p1 GENE.NODE_404_length_1595_cov_285.521429~~NODE_404_length_1595_cov_285.521429.p1  ORF type:complete len:404 (-),score=116.82 NODE_404_length_1595_cov_285.521429:367-1533(-)
MAFKGTRRRSRLRLETEIENMGGHLNAYTSREQTAYYAKCFKDDLAQGVDILADILQHSKLDETAINHERGVILREMEEVEKTVEEVIFDRLHLTAFHESPLGYTILGPVENIQSITQKQLKTYIRTNYTADRIVVVAVGQIDHGSLIRTVEEKFADLPVGGRGMAVYEKPVFYGSELLYHVDDEPIGNLAVGYEGVAWTHPDSIGLMLLQTIIGFYKKGEGLTDPWLSGNRATNNLAIQLLDGGCESFSSFNTCYKDTGIFGVYLQATEAGTGHCIQELLFHIGALAHNVTDEEVARGKRQLKATLFGALDSTTSIAEDIGRQLLVYGRHIPIAEFCLRLEAIDTLEVQRVAKKYLLNADIAVTAMGPLKNLPSLPELRTRTVANRL